VPHCNSVMGARIRLFRQCLIFFLVVGPRFRWRANALLVSDEVRKFAIVVEALGQRRSRIDELDDPGKRLFHIGSSGHRWRVMGSGEAVQTLTAEVNQLRRPNEALREEIRAKDAEIARLKR
jgi:hypothetical protein